MIRKTNPGKEQALQKIKHFCSYQERCHSEVKSKLYDLGLWKEDVEVLLSQLIEEDYLNEERFAMLFAGGKFRLKKWGRNKIVYELKQKQVSPYCIKKALKEIHDDDYLLTLKKLATDKLKLLKSEKNVFVRKRKITDYLLQKGYEADLIRDTLAAMTRRD